MNIYQTCLWAMIADGPALVSSVTRTSLIGATNPKLTLPNNFIPPDGVGKKFRFKASGRISTLNATPGTLTLDLAFGAVVIATSQALTLTVTAQTNATWDLEWDLTVRAVGAGSATNFMHTAKLTTRASFGAPAAGTATGVGIVLIPDTAPVVGTGFDSSATQQLDFFGTWQTSNAANSILCHQASFEYLN